jgi:Fe-S cluster assembly protein SufD
MSPVMVPASDHAPVVVSFDPGDFPEPTGREEEWRFTPLARLGGLLDVPQADAQPDISVSAPGDVIVEAIPTSSAQGLVSAPHDRVAAAAWAGAREVTAIRVAKEMVIDDTITAIITTPQGVSFGQVLIDLGEFSTSRVMIRFVGSGVFAGGIHVIARDHATATVAVVVDSERDAVNVSRVHVRLGRDAAVRSTVISLGGDLVRVNANVEYTAPGGDAELLGLFFADQGQHHEHRVFVDHSQPHGRSSVVYKGALEGAGTHTVWIGDVLVRAQAIGIDTYEVNRNLVLSDGARADSVPNLELETGEVVGAGHASATGRFDDEQMFYMRSRGISEDIARMLVVRGFFADVLGRTGIPGLSDDIMTAIDARLGVVDLVATLIPDDESVADGGSTR